MTVSGAKKRDLYERLCSSELFLVQSWVAVVAILVIVTVILIMAMSIAV